jgi:hypothetical protein
VHSHVGWFHDRRICQLYPMGPLIKVRIVIQCSYIQAELGNTGGVILLALCIGITIHPNNSHRKHISS